MTTILLQTLFIAARIKGDLLVCLEEAEEVRKRRQNAPVARVENAQSYGITPVIKGPLFVFLSVLFVFSAFAKPPARQVFAAIPVDCDTVKM